MRGSAQCKKKRDEWVRSVGGGCGCKMQGAGFGAMKAVMLAISSASSRKATASVTTHLPFPTPNTLTACHVCGFCDSQSQRKRVRALPVCGSTHVNPYKRALVRELPTRRVSNTCIQPASTLFEATCESSRPSQEVC